MWHALLIPCGRDLTVRGQDNVEAEVDTNDAYALADLQMHWDEAYVIGFDGDTWSARFRGSADQLSAESCSDLRELIRTDYHERQRATRASTASAGDPPDPASDRPAEIAGSVDLAAIRGERMST